MLYTVGRGSRQGSLPTVVYGYHLPHIIQKDLIMKLKAIATLGTAMLLLTGCSAGTTESVSESVTKVVTSNKDKVTIHQAPPLKGSIDNYVTENEINNSNKKVTYYKLTPNPETGKFGYLDMSGRFYDLTAEFIEVDKDGQVLPDAEPIFKTITITNPEKGYFFEYGEAPALPESGILRADNSSGQLYYTWTGSVFDFEHVFSGQPEK